MMYHREKWVRLNASPTESRNETITKCLLMGLGAMVACVLI